MTRKVAMFLSQIEKFQRIHISLNLEVTASTWSLTQNIAFHLRKAFCSYPSDAIWRVKKKKQVLAESSEMLAPTTKS